MSNYFMKEENLGTEKYNLPWNFKGNYKELKNNAAPLANGYISDTDNDAIGEAAIIIEPEIRCFDVFSIEKILKYANTPMFKNKRILTIKIPGNINGKNLTKILKHKYFVHLLKSISHGYSIKWDGRNNIGHFDEKSYENFVSFLVWLEYDFDIRDKVDRVETGFRFISPIEYLNCNGERDSHNVQKITICDGKYTIDTDTNIETLINTIIKDDKAKTKILHLESDIIHALKECF